jgi:thiol:disulfide interchange protein
MERVKHIIISVAFALITLLLLCIAIINAAIGHYDTGTILFYGMLITTNIVCFIFEMIKVDELKQKLKHVDKEDLPVAAKELLKKQEEKARLQEEIKTDKERSSLLDKEIGELSEEIDIKAIEEATKNYE